QSVLHLGANSRVRPVLIEASTIVLATHLDALLCRYGFTALNSASVGGTRACRRGLGGRALEFYRGKIRATLSKCAKAPPVIPLPGACIRVRCEYLEAVRWTSGLLQSRI